MKIRCDLKLDPSCAGEAEVRMTADGFGAASCIPCGKMWQRRFPHKVDALSVRPIE